VALGPGPGIIDLEVDEPEGAARFFGRLFSGEPPATLGWRSERGEHRLYRWDDRVLPLVQSAVAHLAGGAVELRLGAGRQLASVCPPSPWNGGRREWNGTWDIAPLPAALLEELARSKAERAPRAPGRRTVSPAAGDRYALAALSREARALRQAAPGTRNCTLNRAAYYLGELVGAGILEREVVESTLTEAALACGLPEGEIAATLRSGLEAGLLHPRPVRLKR
jgi:hypothetical protein